MNSQQIANTIAGQIRALDRSAFMAWGTQQMQVAENGLRFKTSGMVRWKGYVTVTLNHSDLYDIRFEKVWKHQMKLVNEVNDVFCGDLVEIIDAQVG